MKLQTDILESTSGVQASAYVSLSLDLDQDDSTVLSAIVGGRVSLGEGVRLTYGQLETAVKALNLGLSAVLSKFEA